MLEFDHNDYLGELDNIISAYDTESTVITRRLELLEDKKKDLLKQQKHLKEAKDILNEVNLTCQREFKSIVEDITTEVLQEVFGDDYRFTIDYKIMRGKPEASFGIFIGDAEHNLKNELGGGVVDVVSLCLRIILWAISPERSAPIMLLDEPVKFLSKDKLPMMGDMLRTLSEQLGLQFIIITHEQELMNCADKSWEVKRDKKGSYIEEQKGLDNAGL